jgi:hypothetical protein
MENGGYMPYKMTKKLMFEAILDAERVLYEIDSPEQVQEQDFIEIPTAVLGTICSALLGLGVEYLEYKPHPPEVFAAMMSQMNQQRGDLH